MKVYLVTKSGAAAVEVELTEEQLFELNEYLNNGDYITEAQA